MERKEIEELYHLKIQLEKEKSELLTRFREKWFFQVISKVKLKTKLTALNKKIKTTSLEFDSTVRDYLINDNSTYGKLIQENKKLMTRNDFILKVYRTGTNYISSTEKKFSGYISDKGFLYLFVNETNVPLIDLQDNLMSRFFQGEFDDLGNFSATSVQREFFLFIPRIPEFYKARAHDDHSFEMTATQKSLDLSGKYYVDRMIGDPFNENSNDRHKYLDNRAQLIDIRDKFLSAIIADY